MKRCLIVGIDNYAFNRLSSAVNDALKIREKLIALRLFEEDEIDLFASPRTDSLVPMPPKTQPATCDMILGYFKELYRDKHPLDRFLFYFAGHGISAWSDPAQAKLCNVILPSDVVSVADDGRRMIDLDDLRAHFKMRGPVEQFYVIDACRDLGWDKNPAISSVGWAAEPDIAPRRQATLFAVAPRGQALGRADELGVMTRHFVDALDGKGCALDWIVQNNQRIPAVTIQSARDYVRRRVEEQLKDLPSWKLYFSLPVLDDPDPKPDALLLIAFPPQANFTVKVEPSIAEPAVAASLDIFGYEAGHWPPFGQNLQTRPTIYELSARLLQGHDDSWRLPEPTRRTVDVREESVVTLMIESLGGPPASTTMDTPPPPTIETRTAPTAQNSMQALTFLDPEISLETDRSDEVTIIQYMLRKSLSKPFKVDGIFGPITEAAVRDFQRLVNVQVSGSVDQPTWEALHAKAAPEEVDWPEFSAAKMGALKRTNSNYHLEPWTISIPKRGIAMGSRRSESVRAVQYMTRVSGVAPIEIDGEFGEITHAAVRLFQKQEALPVNGRVGPKTWQAMLDRAARRPAMLEVRAIDPGVTVEAEALSGSRETHTIANGVKESLAPGPYRVRITLGEDVLNEVDLVLAPGQSRVLHATAERGQALSQLLAPSETMRVGKASYQPSEKIGPMQGAVLPTLLPLIGLKSFDRNNLILPRLRLDVPRVDADLKPDGYIAVTIALEGSWKRPCAEILQNVHLSCTRLADGTTILPADSIGAVHSIQERIALGLMRPGLGPCGIVVTVPGVISLDIASCSIPRRLTCVGIVIYADGRVRLSQSLLLPPDAEPEPGNDVSKVTPQRVARLLALAEPIYSGRAFQESGLNNSDLENLEHGKWTDPILGVLAWLARTGSLTGPAVLGAVLDPGAEIVANNLERFFGSVPDVAVIRAVRKKQWNEVLSDNAAQPLFAAMVRVLAAEAIQQRRASHSSVDRCSRLSSGGGVWNMLLRPLSPTVA